MKGKEKTKEQLMDELVKLRLQISKLQKSEIKHQQIEETLREIEEKYRTLIELTDIGIQIETVEGRILECNTAGAKMFGYTKEEMIGLTLADLVPEEFAEKLPRVITDKETSNGIFVPRISKKKDGSIFPTEIATKIVNIAGKPRLIAFIRDITKRKEAEKKLRKARKMFASLFNSSPEALVYLDEKSNIINVNPRFTKLFGYTLEEIKGRNLNDGMIHPPDKIEEGKNLDKTALSEGYFNYKSIRKKKDGTLFPVSISGSNIIIDGQLRGIIGTYIDISERKKLEEKLKKLAHFDILTGCYSRGHGLSLLKQQIKTANRKKTPILLFYLDIDDFKHINDTFGHQEGDKVLKETAKLFKSTLREVDSICRIGGDEFLLIFPESSLNDVPLIRERISKNLEKLNQKLNRPYKIDFSIGLSCYDPAHPLSIDKLIRIADENMYKEKKKKKEGF
jgi:diguanylate cyclase (GGDEF)-like protein/PAS domain S-box-containing protein